MAIYYNSSSTKPEKAHTIAEFVSNGSSLYGNKNAFLDFCFVETIDGVPFVAKNIVDNYLYDLKELAVEVKLSNDERDTFAYNPKRLSYKLYKTTMWYWLILKINDMADVHEFDLSEKKKLYLLRPSDLSESMAAIYRAEQFALNKFNDAHKNETYPKPVVSYR
jgi:hypothetical protein